MAIQVSGVNVIDDDRNLNVGVLTATSLDVPPLAISFSPSDGSSDVSLSSNIVISFNSDLNKGSGNITIRDGSASGTILETIAVSSGNVSISGGVVTINPSSDFPTGKDIYVVVPDGAFESSALGAGTNLINTYNFTTGPITTSSFSPSDGATLQSITTNIVITFSENITKGSGNITLRASSASGTIRQTIDVTSGAVSVSGTQATINPPSDLQFEEDTYVVVDAGCFRNSDVDVASGNAIINTYNFTTESDVPPLGGSYEGGLLICCSGGNLWIVAPSSVEVKRSWWQRAHAATSANANAACGDWFVPTLQMMQNPGFQCRTHWDSITSPEWYWGNNTDYGHHGVGAKSIYMTTGGLAGDNKNTSYWIRSFRCVSY